MHEEHANKQMEVCFLPQTENYRLTLHFLNYLLGHLPREQSTHMSPVYSAGLDGHAHSWFNQVTRNLQERYLHFLLPDSKITEMKHCLINTQMINKFTQSNQAALADSVPIRTWVLNLEWFPRASSLTLGKVSALDS